MTLREKQEMLDNFCDDMFDKDGQVCDGCMFNYASSWCHVGGALDISEDEIDTVLAKAKINPITEDVVNHPNHYTNGGMECIDEMILVFGKEAVVHFCLCNAWKYRYRALFKNGEEDMNKSHWYMKKYKELSESV